MTSEDYKVIKLTDRRLVSIHDYKGVCHHCNSPLHYNDELVTVELGETEDAYYVFCIDVLQCPSCKQYLGVMIVYKQKALNITQELEKTYEKN